MAYARIVAGERPRTRTTSNQRWARLTNGANNLAVELLAELLPPFDSIVECGDCGATAFEGEPLLCEHWRGVAFAAAT